MRSIANGDDITLQPDKNRVLAKTRGGLLSSSKNLIKVGMCFAFIMNFIENK
jgi:hypothetical protein